MTLTDLQTPADATPQAVVTSSRRRRVKQSNGVLHRVLSTAAWAVVVFNILALLWSLDASLRRHRDIFSSPWGIASKPYLKNYSTAWTAADFGGAALNSVLLVVSASVTILVIAAPCAYALARTRTRWAGFFTIYFALGIGIPVQVIIIPLFTVAQHLHLINSLVGLFVMYTAFSLPFAVFLLTGFFRSLPGDLEEAAALDGASAFRTFAEIMLPLARPGLITAFMITALSVWNETFVALIFIQSTGKRTLPLALLGFLATQQYSGADYGALFAGLMILMAPMIILYMWLSRRIIEGLTVGTGK